MSEKDPSEYFAQLPTEVQAQVVRAIRDRLRDHAYAKAGLTPAVKEAAGKEPSIAVGMAFMDLGISVGMGAVIDYLAKKDIGNPPRMPDFRGEILGEVDRLMKTDPEYAGQAKERAADLGFDLSVIQEVTPHDLGFGD